MHGLMISIFLASVLGVESVEGPCDILGAAGNPCVAAHSTTRALYAAYDGPLYNVTRSSDGASANISVLGPGGFANASAHDAFCAKLDCVISQVFDQSPQGNHLHQRHKLVNASQHRILVGDNVPVYGMWFEPGYGYHQDNTTGIATGNDPESIYAVMSGTTYNGQCCFDYGNSETDDTSNGAGAMEAIYFVRTHEAHTPHLSPSLTPSHTPCRETRTGRGTLGLAQAPGWAPTWRRGCTMEGVT